MSETVRTSDHEPVSGRLGLPGKARTTTAAASQGFFVDMVDVYVAALALAPAMVYFQPAGVFSEAVSALLYYFGVVSTLIARPIGAFLFGSIADRRGRRSVTLISVAGFGIMTLLIAFLPGYASWGVWAPIALIALRFVNGIFLGGEYTAAIPLALEYSPKKKRGLVSGVIESTFAAAFVFVAVIMFIMLRIAPEGDIDSPYVQWGWRVPFVLAALLSFAFLVYRWRSLPESELWRATARTTSPLRGLLERENLRSMAQVVTFMTGAWLAGGIVLTAGTGVLVKDKGISSSAVSLTVLVTNVVLTFVLLGTGILSQRTGRRPLLAGWGVLTTVVGTVGYGIFSSDLIESDMVTLVLFGVVFLIVTAGYGAIPAYINERFRTNIRATGYGVGYSLGLIIANLFPAYMLGLGTFMPFEQTGTVLVLIGGLLVVGGALAGPETKHVDFHA